MASGSTHPCDSLLGQHVLITGGSSGIGLALARQAAAAGARVSIVARDAARLAAAKKEIGANTFTFSADVAMASDVAVATAAAERAHGPVDVLVACAGIARPGYFAELAADIHERTMAVNYFGTLHSVRAVLPGMRTRRRGGVILISSAAALHGIFGYTAYAPSKFAQRGLAEALRAELSDSGVHVAIVYPPDTDTPQLAEENRTKPVETKAITANAGMWSADDVARATWRGLARRQFAIAPGMPATALLWFHSVAAPFLRWWFDRAARRARKN